MFCPKCGAELPEGAAFCGYCGERLSAQALFGSDGATRQINEAAPEGVNVLPTVQQVQSPYAAQQPILNDDQKSSPSSAQQPKQAAKPAVKRGKGPLIAVAAVVAVALAIVGAGFALGWFGGQPGANGSNGSASGGASNSTPQIENVSGYPNPVAVATLYGQDSSKATKELDAKYYVDEYGCHYSDKNMIGRGYWLDGDWTLKVDNSYGDSNNYTVQMYLRIPGDADTMIKTISEITGISISSDDFKKKDESYWKAEIKNGEQYIEILILPNNKFDSDNAAVKIYV